VVIHPPKSCPYYQIWAKPRSELSQFARFKTARCYFCPHLVNYGQLSTKQIATTKLSIVENLSKKVKNIQFNTKAQKLVKP